MSNSKYIINEKIKSTEVRVVEGLTPGIYSTIKAIEEAESLGLDLIEINSKSVPPICKVVDFSKFLYEEKKKKKIQEDKQTKVSIKEIRFTPNIGDNDFEVKKKKAFEFLSEGNKIRVTMFFKGRNITFKDRGEVILLRLADDLKDVGIPEFLPKMESKNKMSFIIKQKK